MDGTIRHSKIEWADLPLRTEPGLCHASTSMMSKSHSGSTRQWAYQRHGRLKQVQDVVDAIIDRDLGKTHRFTVYRIGDDVCAKCRKTRAEHV